MVDASDFEAVRNRMGLSPDEFYAVPRDPPSSSKLPIFDEVHVRNAMARFNQVAGVSSEEKRKAFEKIMRKAIGFHMDVSGFKEVMSEHGAPGSMMDEKKKKEMMPGMPMVPMMKQMDRGERMGSEVKNALQSVVQKLASADKFDRVEIEKLNAALRATMDLYDSSVQEASMQVEAGEALLEKANARVSELESSVQALKEDGSKARLDFENLKTERSLLEDEIKSYRAEKREVLAGQLVEKELSAGILDKASRDSRFGELKDSSKYSDSTIVELSRYADSFLNGKSAVLAARKTKSTEELSSSSIDVAKYHVVVTGDNVTSKEF